MLTALRYPNTSEIANGPKKGKNIPPPPGLEVVVDYITDFQTLTS